MATKSYSQKVIVMVSDGISAPELDSPAYNAMVAKVDAFRQSGGIVICVGLDASGAGYALMQRLATPGFFRNALSSVTGSVQDTVNSLVTLMTYYCGSPDYTEFSDLY